MLIIILINKQIQYLQKIERRLKMRLKDKSLRENIKM